MDTRNPDDIHIWFAGTGRFAALLERRPAAVFASVSKTERARYDATVSQRARLQFLLGRYLLRHALCAQGGNTHPPAHWKIASDRHGKPGLSNGAGTPVGFSISHSGDLVAVAFGSNVEPGLDIEPMDAGSFSIRQLLSATQCRQLAEVSGPGREILLSQAWCIKEAAAKAFGLGLRLPFAELDFELTTLDDAEPRWQRGRRRGHDGFRFHMFRFCERYRMCVAYAQPAKSRAVAPGISLWHFDPASRTANAVPNASAAQLCY
jgi:4'-phosphopantetheinyl transferase